VIERDEDEKGGAIGDGEDENGGESGVEGKGIWEEDSLGGGDAD